MSALKKKKKILWSVLKERSDFEEEEKGILGLFERREVIMKKKKILFLECFRESLNGFHWGESLTTLCWMISCIGRLPYVVSLLE